MLNILLAIFGILVGFFGALYNTPGTLIFWGQIALAVMSLGYLFFATRDYLAATGGVAAQPTDQPADTEQ